MSFLWHQLHDGIGLIVQGDPFADIRATRDVRHVLQGGAPVRDRSLVA